MNGHEYRSLILIDAGTGKQEPYLYCDGKPLNDGKTASYDVELEKLLGFEDLFFKSIFASQKAKTISSLTPGKRKELFMELLGFQRYELYAQYCKSQGDEIEKIIEHDRGRLDQIQAETSKRDVVVQELDRCQKDLVGVKEEEKDLRRQIETSVKDLAEGEKAITEDKQKRIQVHDIRNEISVLGAEKWKAQKDHEKGAQGLAMQQQEVRVQIERKQKIVDHQLEIETASEQLRSMRSKEKELAVCREELLTIEEAEQAHELEFQRTLHQYQTAASLLEKHLEELETEKRNFIRDLDREASDFERRLIEARRSAGLIDEVPCRQIADLPEQCKLLSSALAARETVSEIVAKIVEVKSDEYRWKNGLADLQARFNSLQEQRRALIAPTNGFAEEFAAKKRAVGYDKEAHQILKAEIAAVESKGWEKLEEELKIGVSVIIEKQELLKTSLEHSRALEDRLKAQLEDLDAKIAAKWEKCKAMESSLFAQTFFDAHEEKKSALKQLEAELADLNERESKIAGDVSFRESMLQRIDEMIKESEELHQTLLGSLRSLENWRLLQRACSKDGIPALELDAAIPAVSRIANQLVSTFGTRSQILFETIRTSKDKKKQIEGFEIWICSETGRKKIEDLSGGEEVWIEAAIRQAIASYMRKQTGRDLACRWLDEVDGALSSAKAQNYLDMIRISHESEGYYFTFIVSHRQELVAQIQQQVRFLPAEGKLEFVY
jgi:exonuclease SbcC